MLSKLRNNKEGFTLIELMIVIAIIGILAAIAIPNFIAYRNKTFCSQAESDAENIQAAIADYFSEPEHINTPTLAQLRGFGFSGSAGSVNTGTIIGAAPNTLIAVFVTDVSTRCPRGARYQSSVPGSPTTDIWR
ncbi:MAG: prepilin-type N-terminal cleavage/methylation domain-containing protein [Desulfobacteraceae bacterium]|nr:prepilin-type N-terminal cleavage/methylation domain-containing protein [Desulfobacteraceae bacterium]